MKWTTRGIISIFLILLIFVLLSETPSGFILGEQILTKIGVSYQTASPYIIMISFTLFLIAVLEAKREMTVKWLIVLIIVCSFIAPLISEFLKTLS